MKENFFLYFLENNFQNNSTGTVMLGNLETINGKQELDNKGNYKIVDLEPGMYKLSLELKKGWTTKTPQTLYYMLEITNGENYIDKDFQVINKLLEQLIKNLKIK